MTLLQQLVATRSAVIQDLIGSRMAPAGSVDAGWKNQPTWDNLPAQPWNNQPTWDNWNQK